MKYMCDGCNTMHNDKNDIYECYLCDKEICEVCSECIDDDHREFQTCKHCAEKGETYIYPDDFYQFGDGVKLTDDEIKGFLFDVKNVLTRDKREWGVHQVVATGDTLVFGIKYEDEYVFYVCKNYQELSVAKEDIDKVEF